MKVRKVAAAIGAVAFALTLGFVALPADAQSRIVPPLRILLSSTLLPLRYKLNMTGSGVTCADNPGAQRTDCTFSVAGSGTVTSVATGTGLSGGPITTTGTVALANTAVSPGAYTNANITVDQQGRLTAASNGSSGVSWPLQNGISTDTYNYGGSTGAIGHKFTSTNAYTAGDPMINLFSGASTDKLQIQYRADGVEFVPDGSASVAFFLRSTDARIQTNSGNVGIGLNWNVGGGIDLTANGVVMGVVDANGIRPGTDAVGTIGEASKRFIAGMFGAAVGSQPTCDATTRGATMTVFAVGGASDTFVVCMKAAADTYAWRTVFTAP